VHWQRLTAISICLGSWCCLSAPRWAAEIIRDLLIGAIPPGSIRDWRLGSVAFLGGSIVFLFHHFVRQIPDPLILNLDAAGLALFAVSGAGKALAYDIHPFVAVLMGGITGVGGGTVRDMLLAQVPTFFARTFTLRRLWRVRR
jgi:uncharacterized membrane protein YeiH